MNCFVLAKGDPLLAERLMNSPARLVLKWIVVTAKAESDKPTKGMFQWPDP